MKQFLTSLLAAVPKLPAPDLKSFDAELAKLRQPEDQEAKRLARIAELEANKRLALSNHAAAQRQSDIEALLPEYQDLCAEWAGIQENLSHDLRRLLEDYNRSLVTYRLAHKLGAQLKSLGVKLDTLEHRYPRATPERADHWIRRLWENGSLTTLHRDVEHQLAAEGVGADD